MESTSQFRLSRPTRAVFAKDGAKGFVLIPEGAIVTVESVDDEGRLAKVLLESQALLMFWQDLIDRGERVEHFTPTSRFASGSR